MKSNVSSDFYKKLDEVFSSLEKLLNNYGKSEILQSHLIAVFKSYFYANLINIFFINLKRAMVKKLGLPRGKIGQIKTKCKDLRKDIRRSLYLFPKHKTFTVKDYNDFKSMIKKDFPEFQKIVEEIEKTIDFAKAEEYLRVKGEAIKKSGKLNPDLNDTFMTNILETYVSKENNLPIGTKKITKLTGAVVKVVIPEFSKRIKKTLDEESKETLDYQRKMMKDFESRLYKKWEAPIDLLECLIQVTLESAMAQRIKLSKMPDAKSNSKYEALIQIHTRALQISNEILVLLKSGYPDGANSRWRSLHEIAVIAFFLYENSEEISKRYLDHEIVIKFKEAKDYKANCKKLGFTPLSRKEFNKIRREKEKLCRIYGNDFTGDYGWIPSSLLPNRTFRALEENVKLGRLRPFYNLSCDAVHGGAKGLYRLGLKPEAQKSVLLIGASDYGLADPIQNTAISLSQITTCLLGLKHDFETIVQMQVIQSYVKEIKTEAAKVQENMEKEI